MRIAFALILLLALLAPLGQSPAQQSDYDVQHSFQQRYNTLQTKIDSASTTAELDSLRREVDGFALEFQGQREFLDKALYPETFEGQDQMPCASCTSWLTTARP